MFKSLLNGVSLSSLMLRDADDEGGSGDAKTKLRESLTKNVTVTSGAKAAQTENNEGGEEDEEGGVDQRQAPQAVARYRGMHGAPQKVVGPEGGVSRREVVASAGSW